MQQYPVVPPPQVTTSKEIVESPTPISTFASSGISTYQVQQQIQPNVNSNSPSDETIATISKPKFVQYPSSANKEESNGDKKDEISIPKIVQPNMKISYTSKRVFKVIIIGDANVGKTCLSFRFCNGRFPQQTEATIGVDFRERALAFGKELIRVQLWDTAGQERYRQSIVAHYYRNVNAVVFVYDVTNPRSFKSLPQWIQECRKHALTSSSDTPHILIGNKCDLQSAERVKTDEAQVFADQNDMALFETSALADSEADHVESIFMTLVHKLRQCKSMHVQTNEERVENEKKLLLKANEASDLEDNEGYCC
jgi:Ras-related protein Rab-33B|uniref:Ras-related protein Rab-33 n=1 Tax=Panagrolaimus sp. PS1159 TaxID=55785 RepID=A0AC35GQJ4_9BILA